MFRQGPRLTRRAVTGVLGVFAQRLTAHGTHVRAHRVTAARGLLFEAKQLFHAAAHIGHLLPRRANDGTRADDRHGYHGKGAKGMTLFGFVSSEKHMVDIAARGGLLF